MAIGQNPHDRSHPLPQLRETSISCQLGPGRTQITAAPKSQIVGIPPFSYCAIDARTTADTSFETPTGRYRYISQLGTPHTSIVSARKSRIVGIPPFPNPVKEEEQNDTYPLPTPTHEKQAYLPVVRERGRCARPKRPITRTDESGWRPWHMIAAAKSRRHARKHCQQETPVRQAPCASAPQADRGICPQGECETFDHPPTGTAVSR